MKLSPQQQLIDVSQRFRSVAQGLLSFSVDTPAIVTRDKGIYAYHYAKPVKRLATTLAVDREVLVLISTFEDQQQRTIKTAREIIADSDGRLESTVAVIIHKDPNGNNKLTTWGRSVGLAVLPVFFGQMPGTCDELERHLAFQLFCHDAFDVTGPVSDDVNFFGRRTEAQDLARKLQTGQIRSCLGIRKIGKTSIINRIISEVREHYECYIVVLDCSKDEIWQLGPDGLMTSLVEAIASLVQSSDRYVAAHTPVSLLTLPQATSCLISELKNIADPVLIFIDGVDYITPGSPTAAHWSDGFNPFWRNFRAAYQEALRAEGTLSVMVGGVSSKWFSVGAINGVENAALSFIPEEYLTPLARNATIAMIQKLSRSSGLIFPRDSANMVCAQCSDMPFWVRKACSYIHRQVEIQCRPITLDVARVEKYLSEFIEREGTTLAQVAIQHLFRVYPELEHFCMLGLEESSLPANSPLVTVLRKYGILAEWIQYDSPVKWFVTH